VVSYTKVAGVSGLATVLLSGLLEFVFPYLIAGPRVSGNSGVGVLLSSYNHPGLVGTFWPAGVSLFFVLFVFGIYLVFRDEANTAGMTIFLLAAAAVAFMEVPVLLTRTAFQWTLVSIAGSQAIATDNATRIALEVSRLVVFRIWDVLYNSLLYWIVGGYILLFGMVILGTKVFAHWVGWFSLVVALFQFFNTLTIPLGIADIFTLPGNVLYLLWILSISILLLQLKDRSSG
jgi:hypothetical protein